MKIVYFISVYSHGRGGHAHSLNHISQKIGEKHDVIIISFGPGKSDIIESNPYFIKHIHFNGFNLFELNKKIKKITQNFNPDIYHCFDIGSYNIVRLFFSSNKHRLVVNKCGGPNPNSFPSINNLVLFSVENYDWFKSYSKYENANIHLIPNRVKSLSINKHFRPIVKNDIDFVFIRICRIGTTYEKSILDSIKMMDLLFANNIQDIKLYIIGTIEDVDVFEKISNHYLVQNGSVIFLTNSVYTSEASKMLYLADAVIGTGRGLMEASSLSLPILGINSKGDIPVLLDKHNFQDAFKTNFSERNVFPNYNQKVNMNNISDLILKDTYYKQVSDFSQSAFREYFDLNKVVEAYPKVYKESIKGKRELLSDMYYILSTLYGFFRSNLKRRANK